MTERHFVPGSKLPEYALLQLVKDLGVAGYLKETPCDRTSSLYTPAVHGWKQGQNVHFFIIVFVLFCIVLFLIQNGSL